METLNSYLIAVLTLLSIVSVITTIYFVAFKGAKKNIEQDHRIDVLETNASEHNKKDEKVRQELKNEIQEMGDEVTMVKHDVTEIKIQQAKDSTMINNIMRVINRKE